MKHRLISLVSAVCLAATTNMTAQPTPPAHPPMTQARPAKKIPKPPIDRSKLIDINSATKEQLKTLPGVTDQLAAAIMAGRPYKTKAHLITHRILPFSIYDPIRKLIIAKQPGTR